MQVTTTTNLFAKSTRETRGSASFSHFTVCVALKATQFQKLKLTRGVTPQNSQNTSIESNGTVNKAKNTVYIHFYYNFKLPVNINAKSRSNLLTFRNL